MFNFNFVLIGDTNNYNISKYDIQFRNLNELDKYNTLVYLQNNFFNLFKHVIIKNKQKFNKIFFSAIYNLNSDHLEVLWDFIDDNFKVFCEKLQYYGGKGVYKKLIANIYKTNNQDYFIKLISKQHNFEIFMNSLSKKNIRKFILAVCIKCDNLDNFVNNLTKEQMHICFERMFECKPFFIKEKKNIFFKHFFKNSSSMSNMLNNLFKYVYATSYNERFWYLFSSTYTKKRFQNYYIYFGRNHNSMSNNRRNALKEAIITLSQNNANHTKRALNDLFNTLDSKDATFYVKIITPYESLIDSLDFSKEELKNFLNMLELDDIVKIKLRKLIKK